MDSSKKQQMTDEKYDRVVHALYARDDNKIIFYDHSFLYIFNNIPRQTITCYVSDIF